MIQYSHPTGNQGVRHACRALAEAGLLQQLNTCVNWDPEHPLAQRLPRRIRRTLERRSFPESVRPFVRAYPARESVRLLMAQVGIPPPAAFRNPTITYRLDRAVARSLRRNEATRCVYASDGNALETFREAKRRGIHCVYGLAAAYWRSVRSLMEQEAEAHPEWPWWMSTNRPEYFERKDEEISLADQILVDSTFTRETLTEYPGAISPVEMIPLGFEPAVAQPTPMPGAKEPIRILYVGAVSAAKGMAYLSQAMDMLGSAATLNLIGRSGPTSPGLEKLVADRRWIHSLPHGEVLEEMSQHDLLILPSLTDGFGMVVSEAMSRGLAVIITNACGIRDLLKDGHDSLIVPPSDAEAIAGAVEQLAMDRDRLAAMKEQALATAGKNEWALYRQRIVGFFSEAIKPS